MSQEFFEQIHKLSRAGESFAIATVVRVEKPISAKSGDKGIIRMDGSIDGWVGGGCAQDVIVREAKKSVREAQPRLLRLVGSGAVAEKSEGVLEFPITCHSGGTMDVYIEPVLPNPQLIILGNSPVAQTLAKLASVLNFQVDVFDSDATRTQFPTASEIFSEHDLSRTTIRPLSFVIVSTQGHDDELALEAAARCNAAYIACVASKKKFAGRVEYLRERGVTTEQIARIKAPAGLDIGTTTPGEIAASILAEMIQFRRQHFAPKQAEEAQAVAVAEEIVTEAIDPVCGMSVEIANARYVSEYNGTKYYFCARSCMNNFNREPENIWRNLKLTEPCPVSRLAFMTYQTIEELEHALVAENYVADRGLATAVFIALTLEKPLFLEGEPGVGKTEVAKVLSRALETRLIRLQCYEGLDVSNAVYEWNYPRQILEIRLLEAEGTSRDAARKNIFSEEFLLKRPLLQAVENHGGRAPVLLIDELDRADEEFESFLLELLSDWQITIPELGTIAAVQPPVVVVTSNRTREIHDALKRRCIYHWIDFPTFDKELYIVTTKVPGISDTLAHQIVSYVQNLRQQDLYKLPGVAETLDWAKTLMALKQDRLNDAVVENTLGVLLKYQDDLQRIRGNPRK